ncbi:MAG: 4Fe-4S dicluster domain-containing protein [Syntrophales bacterium]|nr:4Fe-4S dicluster domain-containing protein [Syntrophales bacterium]
MKRRVVKKDALVGIAKRISESVVVYTPVLVEGDVLFKALEKGDEPLLGYANSKNAPKNFFFPRSEIMLRFTRTPKGLVLTHEEITSQEGVLFGARPCDTRSFILLDMLFDQEKYKDPYYIAKRQRTTVVSLACANPPYATCFCTSVGGHPVDSQGADVLITDVGGEYLVEFLTPKGEALVKYFGEVEADESVEEKKKKVSEEAEKALAKKLAVDGLKEKLDRNFHSPFWDDVHKRCLACGTCTYLCPTCHCFDIRDEVKYDDGRRLRNWDSCMFPLFTQETSGHNPRPTQRERWRQRVMHKFSYYPENFGAIACVGCGRCVMYCPVNIDIRKIVEDAARLFSNTSP